MNRRRIGIGTAAILVAGLVLSRALLVVPAHAQAQPPANTADLTTQINRLQRDVRDLQAQLFRISGGSAGVAAGATPPPPVDPVPPQDDAMRQRVNDMEESLRQLTGRMEELGHQIDVLSQKNERLQKQLDFMASNPQGPAAAQATPAPDANVASAAQAPPAAPALAPATGSLGTLPAGTPPAQAANADPKTDFDAAMGLLTRGQNPRARQAFRAFADAHPDTTLGAQALFWSGDIAYSTQKDYEGAAHDFAELLKKYPTAERAPEAMLKLGLSLLSLGQQKEGCVALAALPKTYTLAPPAIVTRAKAEAKNAACG